jgi:AraC-like DNA-binding protein
MPVDTELYERIIAAKLFMDENFHEPIHLEQISQQAYFSRFHFHRLFTGIYGRTPHAYLTSKDYKKQSCYWNRKVSAYRKFVIAWVLKALLLLACYSASTRE